MQQEHSSPGSGLGNDGRGEEFLRRKRKSGRQVGHFLEKVGKTWEAGAHLKSLEANRDRLMDLV
jgi:hypothetical protein